VHISLNKDVFESAKEKSIVSLESVTKIEYNIYIHNNFCYKFNKTTSEYNIVIQIYQLFSNRRKPISNVNSLSHRNYELNNFSFLFNLRLFFSSVLLLFLLLD
jgi:hypothetical protein